HRQLITSPVSAYVSVYTLSLHDALPILNCISLAPFRRTEHPDREKYMLFSYYKVNNFLNTGSCFTFRAQRPMRSISAHQIHPVQDRKSTRLNSSHVKISYAVFCLKKKNS